MREGRPKMRTRKVTNHLRPVHGVAVDGASADGANETRAPAKPVSSMRRLAAIAAGSFAVAALATTLAPSEAQAQEIQITGPLAGAPAVRKLRLHREGRFEIAPSVSFSLLDEYQRTILPGLRLQYHFTDWFGLGVWGGYGFQYTTGLSDELQQKAIDDRACSKNPGQTQCRLTSVNLTRKNLADDQLGRIQWTVAPQVTFVPFRGKIALFSALFLDTDVNLFLGLAIVGLQERAECGSKGQSTCDKQASFSLASRILPAPTFGLGLNFMPTKFFGFGVEWRGLPFSWNTSGFDVAGGGPDQDFPDGKVNGDDHQFHFNSLMTINLTFRLPPGVKESK